MENRSDRGEASLRDDKSFEDDEYPDWARLNSMGNWQCFFCDVQAEQGINEGSRQRYRDIQYNSNTIY